MALDDRVTLHENPFENLVVWEKRHPISSPKHRERTCEKFKTINTIVLKDGDEKDDYVSDYCVLVAATKDSSSQEGRSRPALLSDRDHRHYSTTGYSTFAQKHITGSLYEQHKVPSVSPQRPTTVQPSYGSELQKYNDDEKIFCCNRDVDCIIDYATCMCCVKGVMYHCTKDSFDEGDIAVEPCTCERDPSAGSCVSKWACMALCSLFVPCILCYLPARGCAKVCTCYKQHRTAKRQRGRIKAPL